MDETFAILLLYTNVNKKIHSLCYIVFGSCKYCAKLGIWMRQKKTIGKLFESHIYEFFDELMLI